MVLFSLLSAVSGSHNRKKAGRERKESKTRRALCYYKESFCDAHTTKNMGEGGITMARKTYLENLRCNNGRGASHTALNKTWTNVSILSERHQKENKPWETYTFQSFTKDDVLHAS